MSHSSMKESNMNQWNEKSLLVRHSWHNVLDAALDVVDHLGVGRVPVDVGVPVAAPVV